MYRCKRWTIKKAERQRIDGFLLWWWRRLLRDPWTARRSNQSILKELYPEYWLEGLTLKLKFQYCGHLIWAGNSSEKDPHTQKDWRQEEKRAAENEMVGQNHQLNGHWANSRRYWKTERLGTLHSWGHKESDVTHKLNNNKKERYNEPVRVYPYQKKKSLTFSKTSRCCPVLHVLCGQGSTK